MKATNSARAYGWAARLFHWSVAVLILAAIGLGLYAGSLPAGDDARMQAVFDAYSVHKTVGVAALLLAALRILWTLTQPRPRPLHPERRAETFLAEMVHWGLWIGMVIMPLTGWLLHSAAPGGFSRILWPLGQRLPLVPESETLAERLSQFHETGWWLLAGLIVLHVAGALKHALIDRDDTLARMAGNPDRLAEPPMGKPSLLPHLLAAGAAILLWAATAVIASQSAKPAQEATAPPAPAAASGWAVQQGTLGIEAVQAGNPVAGQFGQWQARIDYDPEAQTGQVEVDIQISSLTLGSVTATATGPDFLNAADHPAASFSARILPPEAEGQPHLARGQLSIAGQTIEAELPFDLTIEGETAKASGQMQLDRRDFGIGAGYADESTVGFAVAVSFDLTATRQ